MPLGAKLLCVLGVLAEGAYWTWLFVDARHGHYPVTAVGWLTLIGDPFAFVLLVGVGSAAILSNRKYRGKDL